MAKECLTCKQCSIPIKTGEKVVKSLLCEGKSVFSLVNKRPNTKFHSNVITKRHCPDFRDMSLQEWNDTLQVLKDSVDKIENYYKSRNKTGPMGYRINIPNGELAGQNQPPHFYMRVVPKYGKDRGTCGSELRLGKQANPEQVKQLQAALQPKQDGVIAETNKLVAKLHDDIGFMAISTKAHLPNDIDSMDSETWAEIYEVCREIMKKIEAKNACHDFNVRWELGKKAKRAWREEAEIPSSYDYSDSEFIVDLFPRYKLQRWWNEGREVKNSVPVGEMENERLALKLKEPEEYAKLWNKKSTPFPREREEEANSQIKTLSSETTPPEREREREKFMKTT